MFLLKPLNRSPVITKKEILLDCGVTLSAGDTVAYLGGTKSSSGFDVLHPAEPYLFRFEGVAATMSGEGLVLWSVLKDGKPYRLPQVEGVKVSYICHFLAKTKDGVYLVFSTPSNAARVIETKIYRKKHPVFLEKKESKHFLSEDRLENCRKCVYSRYKNGTLPLNGTAG